jgi:hypothetical protein
LLCQLGTRHRSGGWLFHDRRSVGVGRPEWPRFGTKRWASRTRATTLSRLSWELSKEL